MAKIGHDVPFLDVESSREREIPICGFNEDGQFRFFLLPIWQRIDLFWFRFTERERFVRDQQNFAGLAIEKGKQGVGLLFKGIDEVVEYGRGCHGSEKPSPVGMYRELHDRLCSSVKRDSPTFIVSKACLLVAASQAVRFRCRAPPLYARMDPSHQSHCCAFL